MANSYRTGRCSQCLHLSCGSEGPWSLIGKEVLRHASTADIGHVPMPRFNISQQFTRLPVAAHTARTCSGMEAGAIYV